MSAGVAVNDAVGVGGGAGAGGDALACFLAQPARNRVPASIADTVKRVTDNFLIDFLLRLSKPIEAVKSLTTGMDESEVQHCRTVEEEKNTGSSAALGHWRKTPYGQARQLDKA